MEPGDRSCVELHANKEVANPTMTYIIRIKDVSPKKLGQVCNCEDTEEVDVGTNQERLYKKVFYQILCFWVLLLTGVYITVGVNIHVNITSVSNKSCSIIPFNCRLCSAF